LLLSGFKADEIPRVISVDEKVDVGAHLEMLLN